MKRFWFVFRQKLSVVIIVSLLATNLTYLMPTNANSINITSIPECEVQDEYIDAGMFYMPYTSIELDENDEEGKRIFKVKRKGNADTDEKVKLTMVDITGKYNRDYKIKVIGSSFFTEKVKNANSSKAIDEYLAKDGYTEYNYSDAIIDGSINEDNIMSDEEKENYEISDEEKEKLLNDANEALTQFEFDGYVEEVDREELNTDAKISGFTDTEEQSDESSESESETKLEDESESESETKLEKETETENETKSEEESESKSETKIEEETESETETKIEEESETETAIESETETKEDESSETESETEAKETEESENKTATESTIEDAFVIVKELVTSTESDASEEVKFEARKSTMSITKAWELATGLKDDRKQVIPDRSNNVLGINPNSLENKAYMNEGIKVVEEELNSAYVELNFKAGQVEKIIELTIINNNKYFGERQVGFNLSGIDGSQVAGMYSSMTLIIKDDEEERPTYINFSKETYYPEDGYITVEIERSGNLSNLVTCMIDSEDITAKENRDYSKVHAELVFGMGINKRVVKIPIMSININKEASFKLKLQEVKGALIGEKAEATCKIRKSDRNFKIVEEKLFGSSDNDLDAGIVLNDEQNFGAGGDDYTLTSIKTDSPINLKDDAGLIDGSLNLGSNSYEKYINGGKGFEVYLEDHSIIYETADMHFSFGTWKQHYDWAGFILNWACSSENADIEISYNTYENCNYKQLYHRSREAWSSKDSTFFINDASLNEILFFIYRYGGGYRTSPKITINSITPILRMYKIRLEDAYVPLLITDDGHRSRFNKYADYSISSIDGAMSDHTGIGYSGKTITVKLDNNINNPFYIKEIDMVKGDKTYTLATNDNENTTSISFKIDSKMIMDCHKKGLIDYNDREGGGKTGEFTIKPVLANKNAVVKIEKDDRVDIKIWNDKPVSSDDKYDTYNYHVGDVLHFTANIKPELASQYQCEGLDMYRILPYSPDWITLRKPIDSSLYFPLDLLYSEIKIVPSVSEGNNKVTVRVAKSIVNKFDQNYGFFKGNSPTSETKDYYDYVISGENDKVCGEYYEIKARCKNNNDNTVWYEINKSSVKYMQDTYYFLGTEQRDSNVVFLTTGGAIGTEFALVGTAYYEDVPLGGNTVAKSWQATKNVGIIIDDNHFGYSDGRGIFSVMAGKGASGLYKKYKVVYNGDEQYGTVQLSTLGNYIGTEEYKIEYEDHVQTIRKEAYSVGVSRVLVKNQYNNHPHLLNIKSTNRFGTAFNAVYINDDVSILTAAVKPKDADGNSYKYTYKDENGVAHTEDENIKRVEFVVIDSRDHSVKSVVEATRSNADKTEWTATPTFKRGKYNEYKSGDKLYIRIVTDRKVGDGKGYDVDAGVRKNIPIFNETTYAAIDTGYQFIEEAERQPYIVDFKFPADKAGSYSLPIIGGLSTMINAFGMTFGIQSEEDRVRLFIGKSFHAAGNRYDTEGKTKSDNGYAVSLSNFTEGFSQMEDLINKEGTERLKTMTLGIPTWTFEPTVGVYFDFILHHDPKGVVVDTYEYSGGGGFIGAILDLRYTFYFLVVGIPCYVGGEVNLTMLGEFGVAVDAGQHIPLNDPSQSFFDNLFEKTHFEFIFRASLVTSAYAGVGIAGTLGVRGGFQLTLNFIYNPFATKRYKEVTHPVGFSVTGSIRIWVDAVLLSIPVPVYTWLDPKNFGYFEDLENYQKEHGGKPLFGSEGNSKVENLSLAPRPRMSEESEFVYNSSDASEDLFGGTYKKESTKTIINNVYDDASPQIISIGANSFLLVYLDDDHSRGDLDRTVLKWTVYDGASDSWSQPQNVDEGNDTADFAPYLCDCGDKILVTWTSRQFEIDESTAKKELLKNMEVYARFFDKASNTFGAIEKITDDADYDYYPKATYEEGMSRIYLYYLKKTDVADINTADDLLNAIQPEVNGSYLMYMLYEDPRNYDPATTSDARWIRDYYYPSELDSGMTEEEKREFIQLMKGQRFARTSIDIGGTVINNPNLADYAVDSAEIYNYSVQNIEQKFVDITGRTIAELDSLSDAEIVALLETYRTQLEAAFTKTEYIVRVLSVDEDGDPNTREDKEIYLSLYNVADDAYYKTVRITNNDVSDIMPKIVSNDSDTYVFWIQNEATIKLLDLTSLIQKADEEEHAINELESGRVNIITLDRLELSDKISNYYPFVSNDDDIYLVWQQNSNESPQDMQTGEIDFKQNLYMSGLIRELDGTNKIRTWSKPIMLTDNDKLNALPTMANFTDGRLMLVNNQYNLKSSGDSYVISDSKLQEIIFKPASSLELQSLTTIPDTIYDDGSKKYQVNIKLVNNGVNLASGFTYTGNIRYDGNVLTDINGISDEEVLAGNSVIIGWATATEGSGNPDMIYVTLTKEQQQHLDKVKLHLNVRENGIGDEGKTIDENVFDTTEIFTFAVLEDGRERVSTGELKAIQDGKEIIITGTLINSGNVDAKGNEKICISSNTDYTVPILTSDYIDLKAGEQKVFKLVLDANKLSDLSRGYDDLVVFVKNDSGEILSGYEMVTASMNKPFNFAINNQSDLLAVTVGDAINLSATYEPSERFKNATVLYVVEDPTIASIENGVLKGLEPGSTVLTVSTKEFGGSERIDLKVEERGRGGGGGSSGGGGGYISNIPLDNKNPMEEGKVTVLSSISTRKVLTGSENVSWRYLPTTNDWELSYTENGETVVAANTFIDLPVVTMAANLQPVVTYERYYFDNQGKMLVGWLNTSYDNSWYYFEAMNAKERGKMIMNTWKAIQGKWYYFGIDGILYVSRITPDGYIVNENGEWVH